MKIVKGNFTSSIYYETTYRRTFVFLHIMGISEHLEPRELSSGNNDGGCLEFPLVCCLSFILIFKCYTMSCPPFDFCICYFLSVTSASCAFLDPLS